MDRKIRVLIVTADFSIGGGQQVVYELAKNLNPDNVEAAVLCYAGHVDTVADRKAKDEFKVIYLRDKGKANISKIHHILHAINEYKPDVVHAHLGGVFYSVIWAILNHGKIVITAHTKPSKAFSKTIEPLIRFLLKIRRACVVGVSEENKIALQEYFSITDHRIQCVNNGVDLGKFYRSDHEKFAYINVARQDDNKNQEAIIRCFGRIHKADRNTQLFLLGDGPTHEKLKELAGETVHDESIVLTGMVSDVENYYAISDVYVQASHREAMPMSMLEAMGAGLPLVATDVGGLRDIVKGNGILVPDNDESALDDAMKLILNLSPYEYKKMSKTSRSIVDQYSSEKMAERYLAIYRELLGME